MSSQIVVVDLGLDGGGVEVADGAAVPLLVVLVEVQGGVPEGAVHLDVLPHRLEDRVLGGVPVQVGLLLVDVVQLSHGLCHSRVQSREDNSVTMTMKLRTTLTR